MKKNEIVTLKGLFFNATFRMSIIKDGEERRFGNHTDGFRITVRKNEKNT